MATKVTFVQAISLGFKNYATFKGVASRSEFWYWALFNVLVSSVASMVDTLITELAGIDLTFGLSTILGVALILPSLAVTARRFKDAGFSAWLLWVQAIPSGLFIGFLIAILVNASSSGIFMRVVEDPNYMPTDAEVQTVLDSLDPNLFVGLMIAFLAALAWSIFQLVVELMPTKTRAQGNKNAPEAPTDYNGTTA